MNWQRTGGNWKQIKGKVGEKWGRLTDPKKPVTESLIQWRTS